MSELSTDIVKERVPFNWGQFIGIIIFAISSTFTLTTIYARFEYVEEEIKVLDEKIEFYNAEQTRRLDTKTTRNAEDIKEIKKAIE